MRRVLVAACLSLLLVPSAAQAADEIVVLRDPDRSVATETQERQRELGGFDVEHRYTHGVEGFAADLTREQVADLRADPEVAAVVPDRPVRATATVTPPGIHRVTRTSSGFVRGAASGAVAVVDSGVDLTHPDLDVELGRNCIEQEAGTDLDGHGTHVAGTIGARNDGAGVVGVAPGTKIYSVKVLDRNGSGTTADVLCGLSWVSQNAAAKNIKVVNMSLGGPGDTVASCATDTDPEHQILCALVGQGVTPVVAAGNDAEDFTSVPDQGPAFDCDPGRSRCPDVPASFPEVVTVSALTDTDGAPGGAGPTIDDDCNVATAEDFFVNPDDEPAFFSNFATTAAAADHLVAAPGMCVFSTTKNGGYQTMSGTSMAAPHVAGVVALCQGEAGVPGPCAGLSTAQIIDHLQANPDTTAFSGPGGAQFGPIALLQHPAAASAERTEPEPQAATGQPGQPGQPQQQQEQPPSPSQPTPTGTPAPTPAATPLAPPRPPATATSKRPRVSLTGGTRLGRLRTTGLSVRLQCPTACTGRLRITVSRAVQKRLGLKSATLATVRVRRAGTIRLKLTKAARDALKRQSSLAATVVADLEIGTRTVRATAKLSAER